MAMAIGGWPLKRVAGVVVLTTTLLCCGGAIVYNTSSATGKSSWLKEWVGNHVLPLIEDSDTEYATGYVEASFRSIQVGASQAEVSRLLGQPLSSKTFPDGDTCWYYSQHGRKSENYYVRAVRFGSNGQVAELFSEFYVD